MNIYSPIISGSAIISGSLSITGSLNVPEGVTGSVLGTASYASQALSSSYSELSTNALSSSYALSSSAAINAISSSYAVNSTSATSAATASFATNFTASNILVNGDITAQTLVVQTVTSSVVYSSGSNIFGNNQANTQQFTGSVLITGSVSTTGALSGTSATFSGNLGINTATPDIIGYNTKTLGILGVGSDFPNMQIGIPGTSAATADVMGDINFYSRNGTGAVVSRSLIRSGLDGATNSNYINFFTMNAGTLAERLKIASTGAATFSSSVTATGVSYISGNSNTGPIPYLQFTDNYGSAGRNWALINGYDNYGTLSFKVSTAIGGNPYSGTSILSMTQGGNVGIGDDSNPYLEIANGGSTNVLSGIRWVIGSGRVNYGGIELAASSSDNSYLILKTRNSGSTAERMRITSGGDVIISGTGSGGAGALTVRRDGGIPASIANESASGTLIRFSGNGSGVLGSISHNGTNVAYNTSSDYRLKEDLKDFDGLDIMSKIKFYDFAWKTDNSRMIGVIAHELEEILPYAVFGKKDAEEMQAVDYSKLVAIQGKAIQQLVYQIEELKALINK